MGKTKTSSFGTGKRESHDSSTFYERSLYEGIFTRPLSEAELAAIEIPSLSNDWANKIFYKSSEHMDDLPNNSIALAFTSPPYNVGKDYDDDMSLKEYLRLIENVGRETYRVLRPGGRYVINIANLGRKPYIPLHTFFYEIHVRLGFLPMGEIIWKKGDGASGNCAWGSWMSAKAPRLRDIHEYLLVFAKQDFTRPDTGETDIHRSEFLDATLSIWNIPPESATRVGHPAPFPLELATRVIELYSYVDDVILDPFLGSGTTCVAALNANRNYVGYDISIEYINIAKRRIFNRGRTNMPRKKTEASELSIAFGILGIENFDDLSFGHIESMFNGTLSERKYSDFQVEFHNRKNNPLYWKIYGVGRKLRDNYQAFSNVINLQWRGPQQQASTVSIAQDLLVGNTTISVKADSDLVLNTSPRNLFEITPVGGAKASRSENWFLLMKKDLYQLLYSSIINDERLEHFPDDVNEFERIANKRTRREIQGEIKKYEGEKKDQFNELYVNMCREVAQASADLFNTRFSTSMASDTKNSVLERIARDFFRMDAIDYVLTGIDKREEFAVVIPELSQWKREWIITNVFAEPALTRRQSVVFLYVHYKNRRSKETYTSKFHVEIRWSHGKFCGAPEAKLYKDFKWVDIAFMETIF